MALYGGIEAGGTKFICALGAHPDNLHSVKRFETTTPKETIKRVVSFFQNQDRHIESLGIGTFGPADTNPDSATYGYITTTPKKGWPHTDLAGAMKRALDVPVVFDTDVNAAAVAEDRWGAAQKVDTSLYMTVGTGIGGAYIQDGQWLEGLTHSEMGHIPVPRAPGDEFAGSCTYHEDCLEGLAAGPSIEARFDTPAEALPPDHVAWTYEAHYLAAAVTDLLLALPPERIILGGGVMHQEHLFPRIRDKVRKLLNGYMEIAALDDTQSDYIVPPALGNRSGVLGAIALAQQAV